MFMTMERPQQRALPAFDAALGRRLKQAIDIERLLHWAYADQAVTGRAVEIPDAASAMFSGGGGFSHGTAYSADDAITVHGYVELLPAGVRRCVIEHALGRSRPDWGVQLKLHEVRPCTVDAAGHQRGKPVVVRDRGNRPLYCPVTIIDRTDQAARRRLVYVDWHISISRLARTLRDDQVLKRWLPLDPAAPAAPWDGLTAASDKS